MKKTAFVLIGFLIFCSVTKSQYRLEIGGSFGGNVYLGDVTPTLPDNIDLGYGALVRINLDSRYAIKIRGSREYFNVNPDKNYSNIRKTFRDPVTETNFILLPPARRNELWDFGGDLEYSFFPMNTDSYGTVYRVSPYVFAGSGFSILVSDAPLYLPNFAFGLGVKWRVLDFVTLGAEWKLKKFFSDKLETGLPLSRMNNPYGLNDSNLINNDYISTIGIFATINLWKYKWKCGSNYMYF